MRQGLFWKEITEPGGTLWFSPALADLRFVSFLGAEDRAPCMALDGDHGINGGDLMAFTNFWILFTIWSMFGSSTLCARYDFGEITEAKGGGPGGFHLNFLVL